MRLHPDGIREILIATILLGGGAAAANWAALNYSPLWWFAAIPAALLWIFVLAFFRDPNRTPPPGDGFLVSPADGTVTEITSLDACDDIDGPAIRIGIFLSIFNVHVNRAPCESTVVSSTHQPGEFLDARHPESGIRNESNTIVLKPTACNGPIIVRQVAGLVARRIICPLKPGDRLPSAARIGLIKFGSRTELIVPASSGLEPAVQLHDQVKGGRTILMRLKQNAPAPIDAQRARPRLLSGGVT